MSAAVVFVSSRVYSQFLKILFSNMHNLLVVKGSAMQHAVPLAGALREKHEPPVDTGGLMVTTATAHSDMNSTIQQMPRVLGN